MDKAHKKIIRENTEIIIKELLLEPILPLLMSSKILSEAMVETIRYAGPLHQQKFKFILDIQKRGPLAFNNFIEALLTTQQYHLAFVLKPESHKLSEFNDAERTRQINISNYSFSLSSFENNTGLLNIVVEQSNVIYSGPDIYEMGHKLKGLALIINNEFFDSATNLAQRKGTAYDCMNLQLLLTKLGYNIITKCDLTKEKMKEELYNFSNHSSHTLSSVVSILSHGMNDKIYGTDGQLLSLEYISALFDGKVCHNLLGKPKIFILQACRGDEKDKGYIHIPSSIQSLGDSTDSKIIVDDKLPNPIKYPTGMDMLFAYATLPGYVSWRNEYLGTWFIRTLVHVFSQTAHEIDILTMLTKVNEVIINNYESKSGHKMLCEFTSRLSKKLYFNPL